jgi:hypothetical protein
MSRVSVLAPLAITVALFVAAMWLLVLFMVDPRVQMDLQTATLLGIVGTWAVVHASVGTLIAWKRSGNRIGRLMQLAAPLLILAFFGYLIGAVRYVLVGSSDVLGGAAAWWGSTTIVLVIVVAFPLLAIVFPDGRLPTPAFRGPLALIIGGLAASSAVYAVATGPIDGGLPDNPFGLVELAPEVDAVLGLLTLGGLVGSIVMAIAATVIRWRRGTPVERAQLKWLLVALAFAPLLFAISWSTDTGPAAPVFDLLSIGSALAVSLAVGVAVTRYRLFEIDRIISRTIGWAVVTGLLVAVFAGGVLALQAVLVDVTQGQTLAVAASTLLAFALFQPIRSRVQRAVDRRFDRSRYDAERAAAAFAERVRGEIGLESLVAELDATVDAAVRPSAVAVWLPPREAS